MADKQLHGLILPSDSQLRNQAQIQRNVAASGALSGGTSPVEALSLQPNERLLTGRYPGKYSALMATEMEELFDAPDIESVPFFGPNGRIDEQGYYALENTDVRPGDPRVADAASRFEGILRKEGTKKSHWRAVATKQVQIDQPFGNDQHTLIAIDENASKVRWMHPNTKGTESASIYAGAHIQEFNNTNWYDAVDSSFSNPTLIYELDYSEEHLSDCLVYDTKGNASRTDSDSIVQWQHVFRTDHDFEGKIVVENGHARLTFDEANNSLTVEEWNGSNWATVSQGTGGNTGNFEVYDVDLSYIGLSRIRGQVIWEDTSDGSLFHLNVQLPRGYDLPQWFVPQDEFAPFPSGLETKLDPVAFDQDYSAQTVQTLVPRDEVAK